jgi:hypothetical protein
VRVREHDRIHWLASPPLDAGYRVQHRELWLDPWRAFDQAEATILTIVNRQARRIESPSTSPRVDATRLAAPDVGKTAILRDSENDGLEPPL